VDTGSGFGEADRAATPEERPEGENLLYAALKLGAPGRIRTRDPLLRRHPGSVAVRRLASLYEASSWTNCLGVSPCVAQYLPPMALEWLPET
jgi:hypothetical protein